MPPYFTQHTPACLTRPGRGFALYKRKKPALDRDPPRMGWRFE